jgi:hypothetical protein
MALPTSASAAHSRTLRQVQGVATLAAIGDATIIAAQGANKHVRLQKLNIGISVYNASAVIAIEDGAGGSVLWKGSATTGNGNGIVLDYGDNGLLLSANTVLNLTVEGANCTCHVSAIGTVSEI